MKKTVFTFFTLIGLFTTQSFARSTGSRGGGDAVVCYAGNNIKSVELLDYFEATQMGLNLDLGPESLAYDQKVKFVVERWAQFDPVLSSFFGDELLNFSEKVAFLDRSFLNDIDDSNEVISPSNQCHLRQMAISRLDDLAPGEKKFLIDKELWLLMNSSQKAGLVLHEVLWSFYKKNSRHLMDSNLIRRFNGIIASSLMKQYTVEHYVQVIRQLWPTIDPTSYTHERVDVHNPSININGFVYVINAGLEIRNGRVLRGSTCRPVSHVVGGYTYYFSGNSLVAPSIIEYYESGAVKSGRLAKSIDIVLPQGQRLVLPELFSKVEFNESGLVHKVTATSSIEGITYWGMHVEESKTPPNLVWNEARLPISEVTFFNNGSIKAIKIFTDRYHSPYSFTWKGTRYEIKYDLTYGEMFYRDAEIEFNENGNIIRTFQVSQIKP